MRKTILLSILLCLFTFMSVFAGDLFQAGTINALLKGLYQPTITVSQAKSKTNLGLGCGTGLGELIELDGVFYRSDGYGKLTTLNDKNGIPYLTATDFEPQETHTLSSIRNYEELTKTLDSYMKSDNIFYAFKITGSFNSIYARSEDIAKPPYKPLVEWLKDHQHIFKPKNINATLVGFRSPKFINGIGVAGYHIHFISEDKKLGGHVFDIDLKNAKVELEPIYSMHLILPKTSEYLNMDFSTSGDTSSHIKKVEHNK